MPHRDPEVLDLRQPLRRSTGHSKAASRLAVRAIIQRLEWTSLPLIYWTGAPVAATAGSPTAALQQRFKANSPGIYAIRLGTHACPTSITTLDTWLDSLAPGVEFILWVDGALIARSLRQLLDSRRFPVLLPQMVGDAPKWRTACEAALKRARRALDALITRRWDELSRICIALGSLDSRLTTATIQPPAAIRRRLDRTAQSPPAHLATGQSAALSPTLARSLSTWPEGIITHATRALGNAWLLRQIRTNRELDRPEVAAAVQDCLLLSPQRLREFVRVIPATLALHARLTDEPRLRLQAAARIQRQAIESAVIECGLAGNPAALAGSAPAHAAIVRSLQQAYDKHLQEALTAYVGAAAPGLAEARQPTRSRRCTVNPVAMLADVLAAHHLCAVLFDDPNLLSQHGRIIHWVRHGGQDHLHTYASAQPLTFESLGDIAGRLFELHGPPLHPPMSRSVPLTLVAIDVIGTESATDWVDCCCRAWPLGKSGHDHAIAVLVGLHAAHSYAPAAQRTAADRALNALARHVLCHVAQGPSVVETYPRRRQFNDVLDGALLVTRAVVSGVTLDSLAMAFDEGRIEGLRVMLDHAPDQSQACLGFVEHWLARSMPANSPSRRSQTWDPGRPCPTVWPCVWINLGAAVLDQMLRVLKTIAIPSLYNVHFLNWLAVFVANGDIERYVEPLLPGPGFKFRRELVLRSLPSLASSLKAFSPEDSDRIINVPVLFTRCLYVIHAATAAGVPARASPEFHEPPRLLATCMASLVQELRRSPPNTQPSFFAWYAGAQLHAIVALANGRIERLLAIGRTTAEVDFPEAAQIARAWRYLKGQGNLAEMVSVIAARPERTERVLRILARLGLCLSLHQHGRMRDVIASLADIELTGQPSLAPGLGFSVDAIHAAALAELARWRPDGALPSRIMEILNRPESLRRELAALETRAVLTDVARQRLARLRLLLSDPQPLPEWVNRDLARHLPPAVDDARLDRLERIAEDAIAAHFASVLRTPPPPNRNRRNWDNALRLYFSIEVNRSLLRKLLRHEATGDRSWLTAQPENARFLNDIRAHGIDADAWLAPLVRSVELPEGRFRIEIECDPLHVLQMGNYFGTCLSEGGCNAFSTVANAVEINKRVIYVYDVRGTIIGRKLIALSREGRLVGFRTYGAIPNCSGTANDANGSAGCARLKDVLDQFCGQLAFRCGAVLHCVTPDSNDVRAQRTEPLALFAKWYNDGPEEFRELTSAPTPAPARQRPRQSGKSPKQTPLPAGTATPRTQKKAAGHEAPRL